MATPQWETLKSTIDGFTSLEARRACEFFHVSANDSDYRIKQALKSAAFEFSKKNAFQYRNLASSYDATRQVLGSFTFGNAPATAPANNSEAAIREARQKDLEARARAEAEALGVPTVREESAPATFDADAVKRLIAEALAQHSAKGNADMIAALVSEAVAKRPPLSFDIEANGVHVARLDGRQHAQFGELLKSVTARMSDGFRPSVWIAGPAGSGKTYASASLARALGIPFEYNGALSMSHEVLGYRDAAGAYHDTAFRRAYENGALYLFDEVDACADNSPLMALNAALANGVASFPDKQVQRHKDNIILAGANTFGLGATADYVGRIKLDGAFLDRFGVKIFWDYDEALELELSGNEAWARQVQSVRAKAKAAGLKVIISPRATMAGAALIAAGFTIAEAAEKTYLGNLTSDQKRIIGAY